MFLVIGNPTNIYLATSAGIDFFAYLTTMVIPTIASGLVSFFLLSLIFRKSLDERMNPGQTKAVLKDKMAVAICLAHLGICIILMALASFLGMQMWKISVGFFISLVVCILKMSLIKNHKPTYLIKASRRMHFEIIPFIIAMFIMVLALTKTQILADMSAYMASHKPTLSFGISSFLISNVINNIPMSVVYSQLINGLNGSQVFLPATFASIIGSNIGALLTPVGALAGIMWTSMLKELGYEFSFSKFIKYTGGVGLASMAAALVALKIII